MKLSFVVPAFNEELLIGSCLQAIQTEIDRARLTGSQLETEIIVVNNASTDRTKEVAQSFAGVRVVDEPRKGLVWARAAGQAASTGEIVAHIDADVMLTAGWLSTVEREFKKDSSLVALSGPFILHDLSVWHRSAAKVWYGTGWLLAGFRVQGGNFVLRRDAWERAGGFDTSIIFYGEDADVARRMKKQGRVKWSWKLPVLTSGRRLKKEGTVKTALTYGVNHLSVAFRGKPFSQKYKDIRSQ